MGGLAIWWIGVHPSGLGLRSGRWATSLLKWMHRDALKWRSATSPLKWMPSALSLSPEYAHAALSRLTVP